jgi:hypothetical protein
MLGLPASFTFIAQQNYNSALSAFNTALERYSDVKDLHLDINFYVYQNSD